MLWVYLTLLAVALWAVVNIIDKYVISKRLSEPVVYPIITGFVGLIAAIAVFLFHGVVFPAMNILIVSLLLGILLVIAMILYCKALKTEDISRVLPLIYTSPFFVLLFATIFLNEAFTIQKYFGIFLILIGAVLISIKKTARITISKAFVLIMTCSFIYGVHDTLRKYALNYTDFWSVFAFIQIGVFIASLFILYFYFADFKKILKRRTLAIMITGESLSAVSFFITAIAVSIGFVSLIAALQATQPFFVLLYVTIISIFAPKILKEEIKGSVILLKIIAIVCMFIGAYLII